MAHPPANAVPVRVRQSAPPGSAEYSRKDKSLGLLCESFVQVYGQYDEQQICLDAAAATLGVERRRIYDIVNVLESVGIVLRKAKNSYAWKGFTQIESKLDDLRRKARSDLYGGPEDFRTPTAARKPPKKLTRKLELPHHIGTSSAETEPDADPDQSGPLAYKPGSRKEKSLGVLSQRFVQLFLLAGNSAVSLDQAAIQLLGRSPNDADPLSASPIDGDASKLLKTKVRRLYDIANILSSLRLIEKVHTLNRKPAFKWLGSVCSEAAVESIRKQGAKRLGSTDDRPRSAVKRRRLFDANGDVHNVSPVTVDGISVDRDGATPPSEGHGPDGGQTHERESQQRQGFDVETTAQLENVFKTFPETYASRWRDYVNLVNVMLMRGQVSRQKAYDSVSNVLRQAKLARAEKPDEHTGAGSSSMASTITTGSKPAELQSAQDKQEEVQECRPGPAASDNTPAGDEAHGASVEDDEPAPTESVENTQESAEGSAFKEADTSAEPTAAIGDEHAEDGAGDATGAAAADATDAAAAVEAGDAAQAATAAAAGDASGDGSSGGGAGAESENAAATQMGMGMMKAAMMGGAGGMAMDVASPWSAEFIENYMQRSRDAGPEHYKAAQEWLQRLKQWQKMTAPLQAVMRNMGMASGGSAAPAGLVAGSGVTDGSRVSAALGRDV